MVCPTSPARPLEPRPNAPAERSHGRREDAGQKSGNSPKGVVVSTYRHPQARDPDWRAEETVFRFDPIRLLQLGAHDHLDQVGNRIRLHLGHHACPMDLDGTLADSQIGGDHLVRFSLYDLLQDFALAWGQ